jgi:hypothetical protein
MFRTLMLVPTVMLALVACGGVSTASNTVTPATADRVQSDGYASLPQSTTADGYYVLGKPDAPVVMTHYSDFV